MAPYGKSRTKSGYFAPIKSYLSVGMSMPLGRTQTDGRSQIACPHEVFQRAMLTERQTHTVYGDDFAEGLKNAVEEEVAEHGSFGARLRSRFAHMILNPRFEMCVGMVILLNFVVMALETDARARQQDAAPESHDRYAEAILSVIAALQTIFTLVYTLEAGVRLYVLRCAFFKHAWHNFDIFIVVTSIVADILEKIDFEAFDSLRLLRMLRMLRTTRVLVCFEELHALVSGLANALKALMWAAVLMFLVLTIWSIFAVEYVKPLMVEIASKDGFGACTWCPSAFDNVFVSNLSFFQIVSGDGWSHVARPLIEEHAWTALVFVSLIFFMVFGLLNLIVAVIVDSASQAREADITNVAARKDAVRAAAWDCFTDMVGELDKNEDGEITVESLKGALDDSNGDSQAAQYLTAMGVELADLDMVFELLDSDGDGKLTETEFTSQLYQMKTQELPITLCYVRNSVNKLHNELEEAGRAIQEKLDRMLSQCADEVAASARYNMHEVPEFPAASGKVSEKTMLQVSSEASLKNVRGKSTNGVFRGKPPPTLRVPRDSAVPAMLVGNPSRSKMASKPSQVAPMKVSVLQPINEVSSRFSNVACAQ